MSIETKAQTFVGIPEDQLSEYKEAFTNFNKARDGIITAKELQEVMASLGKKPTDEEARDVIKYLDKNDKGGIDFNEFISMVAGTLKERDPADMMLEAFKCFDPQGTGIITADSLHKLMGRLGEDLTEQEVALMLSQADKKKNGAIDFEDFVIMWSGIQS